jgi:hypothetical protein
MHKSEDKNRPLFVKNGLLYFSYSQNQKRAREKEHELVPVYHTVALTDPLPPL